MSDNNLADQFYSLIAQAEAAASAGLDRITQAKTLIEEAEKQVDEARTARAKSVLVFEGLRRHLQAELHRLTDNTLLRLHNTPNILELQENLDLANEELARLRSKAFTDYVVANPDDTAVVNYQTLLATRDAAIEDIAKNSALIKALAVAKLDGSLKASFEELAAEKIRNLNDILKNIGAELAPLMLSITQAATARGTEHGNAFWADLAQAQTEALSAAAAIKERNAEVQKLQEALTALENKKPGAILTLANGSIQVRTTMNDQPLSVTFERADIVEPQGFAGYSVILDPMQAVRHETKRNIEIALGNPLSSDQKEVVDSIFNYVVALSQQRLALTSQGLAKAQREDVLAFVEAYAGDNTNGFRQAADYINRTIAQIRSTVRSRVPDGQVVSDIVVLHAVNLLQLADPENAPGLEPVGAPEQDAPQPAA